MKKALMCMLAGMVASMGVAWADYGVQSQIGPADQGFNTAVCAPDLTGGNEPANDGCQALLTGPVYVLGFKLNGAATNSECALYDANKIPSGVNTTKPKDETTESTASDGGPLQMYPYPLKFSTAVSVVVTGTNSECIVYYM